MAETFSTRLLERGAALPDFSLPDPTGRVHALGDRGGLPVVVLFVCNHCPYVVHLADAIGDMARGFAGRVAFFAINSNDTGRYPDDAPDKMLDFAARHRWDFPYLVDADQAVARAYGAACTPDIFAGDAMARLRYCGQFDDSRPSRPGRPNEHAVDGRDLRAALDAILAGHPMIDPQQPSSGCNIKWKPGNEPKWFGHPK